MKPGKKRRSVDYNAVTKAIACLRTEQEVASFLADLCSPAELESMADRWRVIEPLLAGYSYRQIYEQTGVSVTTVGRIARVLREGTGAYLRIYKRLGGYVPQEWSAISGE
jgi:TrpR-related protein YerC/YecD